jgi:hypothetical protein
MGRVQFTRDTTQLKSICFSLVVVNGEHRRILLAHLRDFSTQLRGDFPAATQRRFSPNPALCWLIAKAVLFPFTVF